MNPPRGSGAIGMSITFTLSGIHTTFATNSRGNDFIVHVLFDGGDQEEFSKNPGPDGVGARTCRNTSSGVWTACSENSNPSKILERIEALLSVANYRNRCSVTTAQ